MTGRILFKNPVIRPFEEIAAYETLWENRKDSFKRIAEIFRKYPGRRPTDLLNSEDKARFLENKERIIEIIEKLRNVNQYRPNLLII